MEPRKDFIFKRPKDTYDSLDYFLKNFERIADTAERAFWKRKVENDIKFYISSMTIWISKTHGVTREMAMEGLSDINDDLQKLINEEETKTGAILNLVELFKLKLFKGSIIPITGHRFYNATKAITLFEYNNEVDSFYTCIKDVLSNIVLPLTK